MVAQIDPIQERAKESYWKRGDNFNLRITKLVARARFEKRSRTYRIKNQPARDTSCSCTLEREKDFITRDIIDCDVEKHMYGRLRTIDIGCHRLEQFD